MASFNCETQALKISAIPVEYRRMRILFRQHLQHCVLRPPRVDGDELWFHFKASQNKSEGCQLPVPRSKTLTREIKPYLSDEGGFRYKLLKSSQFILVMHACGKRMQS